MSAMSAEWPTSKRVIEIEASVPLLQAVETDTSPSEKFAAEATGGRLFNFESKGDAIGLAPGS